MGFVRAGVDPNRPKLGQRIKKFFQNAGHKLGKVLTHPITQAVLAPLAFLGVPGIAASAITSVAGAALSAIPPTEDQQQQQQVEEAMMDQALKAELDTQHLDRTSNEIRLYQSSEPVSNADRSDIYERPYDKGLRTANVGNPVISNVQMHSKANNRANADLQNSTQYNNPTNQFRVQEMSLSEINATQRAPMAQALGSKMPFFSQSSMTEL